MMTNSDYDYDYYYDYDSTMVLKTVPKTFECQLRIRTLTIMTEHFQQIFQESGWKAISNKVLPTCQCLFSVLVQITK